MAKITKVTKAKNVPRRKVVEKKKPRKVPQQTRVDNNAEMITINRVKDAKLKVLTP
jgi:hypothetical protein